jgi:hypothetical protein
MGRSVGDIYDSSAAGNYASTIMDRVDRELMYWFSPELVQNNSWWLLQALSGLEAMLLLEEHVIGVSFTSLHDAKTVRRWREAFFSVWDGTWEQRNEHSRYVLDSSDYRKQHRPAIIALFERLDSIARLWEVLGTKNPLPELLSLHPDYPLPYFSIRRHVNTHGKEIVNVERFIHDLIEFLVKDIIYYLSSEKRAEVIGFNVYEVWVAADVLELLCSAYEQSPTVNEVVVNSWRASTIDIWKEFTKDDDREWDDADETYHAVMAVFDRLETVARQHPPYNW